MKRSNHNKPAPRWYRKTSKIVKILILAANTIIGGWGLPDPLLVARLQLWCSIGVIAILDALEVLLANGEEYTPSYTPPYRPEEQQPPQRPEEIIPDNIKMQE